MNLDREFAAHAQELVAAGRILYERGWVPATSGNFSARLSAPLSFRHDKLRLYLGTQRRGGRDSGRGVGVRVRV